MANNFIEYLQETLKDFGKLDSETMEALVEETVAYLDSLNEVLSEGSSEEKTEAILSALKIKEFLELQSFIAAEKANLSEEEYQEMIHSPTLFSDEEREVLSSVEKQVNKQNKPKIKKIKPTFLR